MKIAVICYYDGAKSGLHLYQALKSAGHSGAYANKESGRDAYARAIADADAIITACDSLSFIKDDGFYIYDNNGREIFEDGSGHEVKPGAVMISMPVGAKYRRKNSGYHKAYEVWPLSEYRNSYDVILPVEPSMNYPEINDGWLPHAINTKAIHARAGGGERFIVGAYMANQDSKNVDRYLRPAIEQLQGEGLPVEYELSGTTYHVPHSTFMDNLCTYAMYYGQITPLGVYGRSEVEAMALGIPVICGILDIAVKRAGDISDYGAPCLKAYNAEDVARVIRDAMAGKIDLEKVGRASREYAVRVHSYEAVAKRADGIIKMAIQRKKNVSIR